MKWVPLNEVVEFTRTPVELSAEGRYQRVGIYSWGRGHFLRAPVSPSEMGAMRYFTFPERALIFSNIQAWEGAVALTTEADVGAVASSRFYPYVPRPGQDVSLEFLFEFFRSRMGQKIMRDASSGTQVRNKLLSRTKIESALVPLPTRPEQERIVDHLASLGGLEIADTPSPLLGILKRDWKGVSLPVRNLVKPVVRSVAVDPEATYSLSGVKWYGQGVFIREKRTGRDLAAKSLREIRAGDLVYNRLFAWKQSFALAGADGWASNEFPTFEVDVSQVHPRVLLAALLSPRFTESVHNASTGSTPTSRNRLKESDFLELSVTIPRADEQPSVSEALRLADQANATLARRSSIASAILPAARNAVFASMV